MCQYAAGKLMRHLIERRRKEVVGGNERKDGRSRIGSPVHVANMNFIEGRFANTEHQGSSFLEANVGGALQQLRCNSVRHASKSPDAARQHDHRLSGIRTAGNIRAYIGIRLLLNLARLGSEQLRHKVVAPAQIEFFGHHSQRAIRGNEVYGLDAIIVLDREQQVAEKNRTATPRRQWSDFLACTRFQGFKLSRFQRNSRQGPRAH